MKILIFFRPKPVLNFSGDTDFDLHWKERGRIRLCVSTVGHPFLIVTKEQFCEIVSEQHVVWEKHFSFYQKAGVLQIEVRAVGWRLKSSAGAWMPAVVLVAAGKQCGVPACWLWDCPAQALGFPHFNLIEGLSSTSFILGVDLAFLSC